GAAPWARLGLGAEEVDQRLFGAPARVAVEYPSRRLGGDARVAGAHRVEVGARVHEVRLRAELQRDPQVEVHRDRLGCGLRARRGPPVRLRDLLGEGGAGQREAWPRLLLGSELRREAEVV